MTSAAKIAANRANARASTGPKSAAGGQRSARNALRHGLTLPVSYDPVLSPQIDAWADAIAGPDANDEIRTLARLVADAQIELCRVRLARHHLLSEALAQRGLANTGLIFRHEKREPLAKDRHQAQEFATFVRRESSRLFFMDRYERRAWSRRKFAVRALDAARRRAFKSSNPVVADKTTES